MFYNCIHLFFLLTLSVRLFFLLTSKVFHSYTRKLDRASKSGGLWYLVNDASLMNKLIVLYGYILSLYKVYPAYLPLADLFIFQVGRYYLSLWCANHDQAARTCPGGKDKHKATSRLNLRYPMEVVKNSKGRYSDKYYTTRVSWEELLKTGPFSCELLPR